jgi:hypothetical protein
MHVSQIVSLSRHAELLSASPFRYAQTLFFSHPRLFLFFTNKENGLHSSHWWCPRRPQGNLLNYYYLAASSEIVQYGRDSERERGGLSFCGAESFFFALATAAKALQRFDIAAMLCMLYQYRAIILSDERCGHLAADFSVFAVASVLI